MQQALNQLDQIQAYYEIILEEMDSLNLMFSTSPRTISRLNYIFETDQWEWQDLNDARMIQSYLTTSVNARPYIDSIYIYLNNTKNRLLSSQGGISSMDQLKDVSWFQSYKFAQEAKNFWVESKRPDADSPIADPKNILRIYRMIYDSVNQPIGVIVLNLLADHLTNAYPFPYTAEDSFLIISDTEGNRLLSIPGDYRISPKRLENSLIKFSKISPRYHWNFEIYIPKSYLYHTPYTIGLITIALFIFSCVLGLLLTLRTNIKENRFQKMEQELVRMEKETMEYRTLQMQINPHFLYNTLETINWQAIALLKGPNDISRMIQLLSHILKYTIQFSTTDGVSLENEIEYARYYLELQQYRFRNSFTAEWAVEEGIGAFRVPRFILQPLLENSLTHGMRDDDRPLAIKVTICRKAARIVLLIEDNGEGIDDETLRKLNTGEPDNLTGHNRIGIANICRRIRFFYHDDAYISVTSEKKKGTCVSISLPAYSLIPTVEIPSTK
jgi:two-component system sensor histidine kinase YesM